MNDRFKFRVWNKIEKTYSDIPYGSYALSDSGELFWIESNCDCSETNTEDYIIEQCTGLKDKNGKLIFEGDVVRINGWWYAGGPAGYDENKCVVEYDEEVAGFTPMCNYDCDCDVYHDADECEVIGNIHTGEFSLEFS